MMNCPMCGQAAHTRSSFQVSSETKERYNQCTNIECGHTFVTHDTFVRSVCRPQKLAQHCLIRKACRNNLHINSELMAWFYCAITRLLKSRSSAISINRASAAA